MKDSPKKRGQKPGVKRVVKQVDRTARAGTRSATAPKTTTKTAAEPAPPAKKTMHHDAGSKGQPVFVDELPDDITAPPEGE